VRARGYRPAPGPATFRAGATYLITGGFGGMGLAVARWLVDRGARHVALLGRRAPTDAARERLGDLERSGARLLVEQADVGSEPDLERVLDRIASGMPPLRGVIHAAGIFDDRVLVRHDWDRFARVLRPKLNGAWNLHRLTRATPLDFFVLFSSAASFMGPVGLGNYTAANAFLDALAHHRRHAGLPALSIDWGPWHQVGMAEAVGAVRQSQWVTGGFGTMAVADALDVLGDLLQQDRAQVGVLPVRWSQFTERFGRGREPAIFSDLTREDRPRLQPGRSTADPAELRRRLDEAAPGDRAAILIAHVSREAVLVLGFEQGHVLDPLQSFFEMGMDSLTAVDLKNRLQSASGCPLPSTLVFDHPSVEALATYLGRLPGLLGTPAVVTPPEAAIGPEQAAELLGRLSDLSDEEVSALLGRMSRSGGDSP
jgi:acyl carrier protein